MPEISVKAAYHVKSHMLKLEFSDSQKQFIDFEAFMFSVAHSDYEKYKFVSKFQAFKIIDGNFKRDDRSMIFSVEELYENNALKKQRVAYPEVAIQAAKHFSQ